MKICGLKPDTTEDYLIKLLEPFGQVDAVHLYRNIDNDISHAYVEFRSEFVPETVQRQLADEWQGSNKLRFVVSRDDDSFNHRTVVLGNLPPDMMVNDPHSLDLLDLCRQIGSVT